MKLFTCLKHILKAHDGVRDINEIYASVSNFAKWKNLKRGLNENIYLFEIML